MFRPLLAVLLPLCTALLTPLPVTAQEFTITTVAGTGRNGFSGDGGPATAAQLDYSSGVAVDGAGNLYIADTANDRIRKVDSTGTITTIAGTGRYGFSGDGGAAVEAQLGTPSGVAVDREANLYIADSNNHRIRKVDATGTITTVAGSGEGGFGGDGGPALQAGFDYPFGVAVDGAGNLYIADSNNHRIRKVDATRTITTIAGSRATGRHMGGFGGDGGSATVAQLDTHRGVAVDGAGNLYIADAGNHRIRRVDPSGTITTVAGSGEGGFGGDGGAAGEAQLGFPRGVAVDGAGNLYIADIGNHRIRKVDSTGTITTIAGSGATGFDKGGFSGDGGAAVQARLRNPSGVAVDGAGNLYIADAGNHRIRMLTPVGGSGTSSVEPESQTGTQPDCRGWNTEEFFKQATVAVVKHCLDMGADVNARDREEATPLHVASQFGTPRQITVLLDAGADIHALAYAWESGGAYEGKLDWTPLHVAAVLGTPANIKALIEAGANIEGRVLEWAAARGTPANLKALIDAGVDIEGGLHAAVYGEPDNIGVLLEAGADIEGRDDQGRTPLHDAAGGWDADATRAHIEILLEAGADVEARDRDGWTPLHLAAAWEGHPDRVEALVGAGADIEARGQGGWTPLHLAASMPYDGLSSGSPAALDALLRLGANTEAQDDEGQTPLHVAALHPEGEWGVPGSHTKIGVLLEAGADIEARNRRGRTPLHLAAGIEYHDWMSDYLSTLLVAGASVEARDEDGRTPLHLAAGIVADLPGHPDNVTKLLDAGADTDGSDTRFLRPHEYSLWEGDWRNTVSSFEDSVYEDLNVTDTDATGFTYSFRCRDVTYGPNILTTEKARASFLDPFRAADQTGGQTFVLSVDPDDEHSRAMETKARSYGENVCALEATDAFAFRRSIYRAGFDCAQATMAVEDTICRNELLALGDRELNNVYRDVLGMIPSGERQSLQSSQRAWLRQRNRSCVGGDVVDDVCVARHYADRLAALAKLVDSGLGAEPSFDAAYVTAVLSRGGDFRQDLSARLAMYPLAMASAGTVTWQADERGVLLEQAYTEYHTVFPVEIEFRYSDMLFVGWDGMVWAAAHTEPLVSGLDDLGALNPIQVRLAPRRAPFAVWSDTGDEWTDMPAATDHLPELVRSWLSRHPVSEVMRLP